MKTYLKLPCPNCREILPIRAEYFGKRVACKRCKHVFVADAKDVVADAAPTTPALIATAPPPAAVSDDARLRIAQLTKEVQRARAEAATLSANHAAAVEETEQARGQVAELEVQGQALRHESEARQQELADAREEMEWLRVLVGELKTGETQAAETEARLRAELAAASVHAAELEALRAEHETLARQKEEIERHAEELHGKVGALEQAHSEVSGAHGELASTHEEARGRWDTERQELHDQWEEKLRTQAQEAEERLRAEQERAAAEREQLQQERNDFAQQFDALQQVQEPLVEVLETSEISSDEGEQALRDEVVRLNADLEETQRVQSENARAQVELMEQVHALHAERDALQGELEQARAAHAAATFSVAPVAEPVGADAAGLEEQVRALQQETEARHQELQASHADVGRLSRLVSELQKRLSQVSEESEAKLQGGLTDTTRLRNELAAAQASQRQMADQFDALRAERDQLQAQLSQASGGRLPPQHDWDGDVIQKALEGVSTRVGWPWFDTAKKDEATRPAAAARHDEPTLTPRSDTQGLEHRLTTFQQEFSRERLALQNELARLKKENGLLRQYLENFGVQMIES